jgi:hypothetical protein
MSPASNPREYTMMRGNMMGMERANWEMMKNVTFEVIIPMKAGIDRIMAIITRVEKIERNMA